MQNFPNDFRAVVFGASGGIGSAICAELNTNAGCSYLGHLSRQSTPRIDLEREDSIAAAAEALKPIAPFHLLIDATGILHDGDIQRLGHQAHPLLKRISRGYSVI